MTQSVSSPDLRITQRKGGKKEIRMLNIERGTIDSDSPSVRLKDSPLKKSVPAAAPVLISPGTGDQDRFTDAMNRVTDLLKVNQTLREENLTLEEQIRSKNVEAFECKEESEDLRERIDILENMVSNNS